MSARMSKAYRCDFEIFAPSLATCCCACVIFKISDAIELSAMNCYAHTYVHTHIYTNQFDTYDVHYDRLMRTADCTQ